MTDSKYRGLVADMGGGVGWRDLTADLDPDVVDSHLAPGEEPIAL